MAMDWTTIDGLLLEQQNPRISTTKLGELEGAEIKGGCHGACQQISTRGANAWDECFPQGLPSGFYVDIIDSKARLQERGRPSSKYFGMIKLQKRRLAWQEDSIRKVDAAVYTKSLELTI